MKSHSTDATRPQDIECSHWLALSGRAFVHREGLKYCTNQDEISFTRFSFCPKCGDFIDWSEIIENDTP